MTRESKISALKGFQIGNSQPLLDLIRNSPVVAIHDANTNTYKANGKVYSKKEFEILVNNKNTVFVIPDNRRDKL